MTKKNERKLKNYIINWDIQLRVLFHSLIYMFIAVLITIGVILYPILYDMLLSDSLDIQYRSAQIFIVVAKRLVPAIIVIAALFMVHQIIITHRICGPLVNFTHTFKTLAEGDLTRKVYLRHGDYLKRECDKINEMIAGLSSLLKRLIEDHGKLILTLKEVVTRVQDGDTKEKICSSLEILEGEVDYVTNTLSLFKIEKTS